MGNVLLLSRKDVESVLDMKDTIEDKEEWDTRLEVCKRSRDWLLLKLVYMNDKSTEVILQWQVCKVNDNDLDECFIRGSIHAKYSDALKVYEDKTGDSYGEE